MIDQTKVPEKLTYIRCRTPGEVAEAIRSMIVRGAPAIGVAAAMGLALVAYRSKARTKEGLLKELESASAQLGATRPTAVNLMWGLSKILQTARQSAGDIKTVRRTIIEKAALQAANHPFVDPEVGSAKSFCGKGGASGECLFQQRI